MIRQDGAGGFYEAKEYSGNDTCRICGIDCNIHRLAIIKDVILCSVCIHDLMDALGMD